MTDEQQMRLAIYEGVFAEYTVGRSFGPQFAVRYSQGG